MEQSVDYVRVDVQGTLLDGVRAIGGETTGTVIQAGTVQFELDLGGDATRKQTARQLHGRKAHVVGTLEMRRGVEIRARWIVAVQTLEPVPPAA